MGHGGKILRRTVMNNYDIFESALIRFKPTNHLKGKINGEFHFLYQKIGFLELKNQMKWT